MGASGRNSPPLHCFMHCLPHTAPVFSRKEGWFIYETPVSTVKKTSIQRELNVKRPVVLTA